MSPSGVNFIGFPLDHSLTAQGPILGRQTQKGGLRVAGKPTMVSASAVLFIICGLSYCIAFKLVLHCVMGRRDTRDGG